MERNGELIEIEHAWQRFKDVGQRRRIMDGSLFQELVTSAGPTSGIHMCSCQSQKSEFVKKEDAAPTSSTGTPNRQMQSCKREDTSSSGHVYNPFIEYMKLILLPEVSPFYGREMENFKRIGSAFSVKYPSSTWDDRSRSQLFESF